jgi:hypothetical protein
MTNPWLRVLHSLRIALVICKESITDSDVFAGIGHVDALNLIFVHDYAMRTYCGRPSSSMRFSMPTAMATSFACRPSVCGRSPSPMTRFHRDTSESTRARQLYSEAFCQPRRPRSAMTSMCRSRCVGAVSAVSLGCPSRWGADGAHAQECRWGSPGQQAGADCLGGAATRGGFQDDNRGGSVVDRPNRHRLPVGSLKSAGGGSEMA